jgi:hypothetical protein
MKNISEIAAMCGLDWEIVFRTIIKTNIVPVLEKGRKKFYDQFQQELIIDQLYYLGKLEYITYESSINKTAN